MKDELLLHESTRRQLEITLQKPPHALLVIGPAGSGKRYLTMHFAAALQGIPIEKLENQPHYIRLEKPQDKSEIPIDAIREMIRRLSMKTAGRTRVVHIEQAQLLSHESQNALLKNIEEPPPNTHFILTVPAASLLLPTITSRSRKIVLKPVDLATADKYFGAKYNSGKIAAAWNLSRGAPGLLAALLEDDDEHPLKAAVEQAKRFLKMDRYDRTLFLDKLNSDKAAYATFLDALDRLLAALAASSARSGKSAHTRRLLNARKTIGQAITSLTVNASPRLISLHLAQRLTI